MKTSTRGESPLSETACSPSSSTPETDKLVRETLASPTVTDTILAATLTLKCEELERERNAARRMWSIHQDKLAELREQVRLTIMENLHLADGDVCTLKRLKDAVAFDLDSPENVKVMAHPLAGANVDRGVGVEVRWKHRKQRG
jgi:hypothetical protein